jgi:hypothetical protein
MPLKGKKSTQLFASCSMDLIMDLPPIDGCDSILIVVDRWNTKEAILIQMTRTLMQEGAGHVTTSNNVSELSLYSRSVLSEVLLSTVVV